MGTSRVSLLGKSYASFRVGGNDLCIMPIRSLPFGYIRANKRETRPNLAANGVQRRFSGIKRIWLSAAKPVRMPREERRGRRSRKPHRPKGSAGDGACVCVSESGTRVNVRFERAGITRPAARSYESAKARKCRPRQTAEKRRKITSCTSSPAGGRRCSP